MKLSSKVFFYVYVFLIFSLSLLPGQTVESVPVFGLDKIIHLIEYCILGVLYKYCIIKSSPMWKMIFLWILVVPIVDEFFIQNISNRTVDPWDFIFNIIGLLLGILLRAYFDKKTYN